MPTTTFTRDGDGWVGMQEQEWDSTEVGLMEALAAVEQQTCKGCGGDLSVELTDLPPELDDGGGHFHRFTHLWCRGCVARAKLESQLARDDEKLAEANQPQYPQARFLVPERLPIPEPTQEV